MGFPPSLHLLGRPLRSGSRTWNQRPTRNHHLCLSSSRTLLSPSSFRQPWACSQGFSRLGETVVPLLTGFGRFEGRGGGDRVASFGGSVLRQHHLFSLPLVFVVSRDFHSLPNQQQPPRESMATSNFHRPLERNGSKPRRVQLQLQLLLLSDPLPLLPHSGREIPSPPSSQKARASPGSHLERGSHRWESCSSCPEGESEERRRETSE